MINKDEFANIPIYPDGFRRDFINVFLSCKKTQISEKLQNNYCLNEITIPNLFTLKERGVCQIIATRSNCSVCEFNNCEQKFDFTIEKTNNLLEDKNINSISIQWIDENSFEVMLGANVNLATETEQSKNQTDNPSLSRRNFLNIFTTKD